MNDVSASRKNLSRHGITWEEKCWLVYRHQYGLCALCQNPILPEKAVIDHSHECLRKGDHYQGRGCKECIRGALCSTCNTPVLSRLESCPWLYSPYVTAYLAGRPFLFLDTPKNNA
jgi:hypothetical protein